jgi:hypothetical protein
LRKLGDENFFSGTRGEEKRWRKKFWWPC